MYLKTKITILAGILIIAGRFGSVGQSYKWETTRGVNIGIECNEQDIAELTRWGVSHIRMTFPVEPFVELKEPYNLVESSFQRLNNMLDICEKYNLKVVIDPHKFPGTTHQWTMLNNDPFWFDFTWHEHALRVWSEIAQRCKHRGSVIAGYAILNEPSVPFKRMDNSPSDLNLFYKKAIEVIRRYDTKHTIILSSPRLGTGEQRDLDYVDGLEYLKPQDDGNLVYEIHMYKPMGFTHQGVNEESEFVGYPGIIDGKNWDIDQIRSHLKPARDFAKKYGVKMYVGEFSCPRWTGDSGNKYLNDVITVFEEYGFSWAYHAYRESTIWDAEADNFSREKTERIEWTPRKELLINAFRLNGE